MPSGISEVLSVITCIVHFHPPNAVISFDDQWLFIRIFYYWQIIYKQKSDFPSLGYIGHRFSKMGILIWPLFDRAIYE